MPAEETFQHLLQSLRKPLSIDEFKSLSTKYTVIDTRLEAQTTGLVKGSYWFAGEAAHCSWLPSFLKQQEAYLCVCDRWELDEVLERFLLMGYCNCVGYNNFDMKHYDGEIEYPLLRNWKELGDTERKQLVDARTASEWRRTGVARKAMLIELKDIDRGSEQKLNILREIQRHKLIIVYCQSGKRAKLASSILFRHGISNICLIEDFNDFPKNGIRIQTLAENQQYWQSKGDRWGEISSQEQNVIEKQLESDNMNRMAVEECYEECLRGHPGKTAEQCRQECANKRFVRKPDETARLEHAYNRNQFEAGKQHIVPAKGKSVQFAQSEHEELHKRSLEQFSSKNYAESLKQLDRLILKNPDNAQLYINRALCQSRLGRTARAYEDLLKALEIDRLNFVAYFNLASLKLSQKQISKQSKLDALSNLNKSLSCLYLKKALKTESELDIGRALELNPENVEALLMEGLKLCEKEQYKQALDCMERINRISSTNNLQLALLYDQFNNKLQSAKVLQQKEVNPEVVREEKQALKIGSGGIKQRSFASETQIQDIDEQINSRVEEWNKLCKQVFGQQSSKLRILEDRSTTGHGGQSVWVIN